MSGIGLHDPDWIGDRIADTARRWGSPDSRVNATLWWYAASRAIVDPPITAWLDGVPIPTPDPRRGWIRDTGYLKGLDTSGHWDATELAPGLVALCSIPIGTLTAVSPATERSLWAILTDAIGNSALMHAPEHAARAVELVEDMRGHGAPMPSVRFQDVAPNGTLTTADLTDAPPQDLRRATRRASCCLIHLTTDTPNEPAGMCASCPRQGRGRGVAMARALFGHT